MKTIILFLSMLAFGSLFGQNNYDSRLLSKFSEERLNGLKEEHSSVIEYWTFYLDHSYEIVDIPVGKINAKLPEINIKSKKAFNIFDYDMIKSPGETTAVYRIEGTNQMLVLHSAEKIAQDFNEYRKSNKNL